MSDFNYPDATHVLTDTTMWGLCEKMPSNIMEFLATSQLDDNKFTVFGLQFLNVLKKYASMEATSKHFSKPVKVTKIASMKDL